MKNCLEEGSGRSQWILRLSDNVLHFDINYLLTISTTFFLNYLVSLRTSQQEFT